LSHFNEDVLLRLQQLDGFHGATVLRRDRNDGVEVTILARWTSLNAIRTSAGEDADASVVARSAHPLFVSHDKSVTHHDVVVEKHA
jgi:heme-degrading monooxygenase HmoA